MPKDNGAKDTRMFNHNFDGSFNNPHLNGLLTTPTCFTKPLGLNIHGVKRNNINWLKV